MTIYVIHNTEATGFCSNKSRWLLYFPRKEPTMSIFTESPYDRAIELLMKEIPKFKPRGNGIRIPSGFTYNAKDCDCRYCEHHQKKKGCTAERCPYMEERIIAGVVSHREALFEALSCIRYPAFIERLNQNLRESEDFKMNFKNEAHRTVFTETVGKMDRKNYALMAALYLLTADNKLWYAAKRSVERNAVSFAAIRMNDIGEDGYTLFCCAKDLCLGTKHITVCDLADTELVSPKLFLLVCNAMAIRRFGLGAIGQNSSMQSGGM